jgi:DNA repair protein RadA/Sms
VQQKGEKRNDFSKEKSRPKKLSEIEPDTTKRHTTNLKEFDRAIGGGVVPGSFILLGGEPGIGKSTLSLQLAQELSTKERPVLYISGEESLDQTSLRAKRLGIHSEHIFLLHETSVSEIIKHVDLLDPIALIIDSIQIVYKEDIPSVAGSVTQVREAASTFMQLAKAKNMATIIIGHVTKSGEIAGPKILEHLVDTVLYFEGDKQQEFRLLRITKNRFGPTDEIAIFEMQREGLKEIKNPSQIFLEERSKGAIGSVIIPTIEGTRPLLIEVQALVTDTFFPTPSRRAQGIDPNRIALLLAVLEKRCKLHLHRTDVFVSVTGGFRIQEPACDLGIALSIASSFCNRKFNPAMAVLGEIGLGGEVRTTSRLESRLKEAIQMGFTDCLIPKKNFKNAQLDHMKDKIKLHPIEWVDEAIDLLVK